MLDLHDYRCYDTQQRQEVLVHLNSVSGAGIEKLGVPKDDIELSEERQLLLKRVVADASQYLDKGSREVEVTITHIDIDKNLVEYRIGGSGSQNLHSISLKVSNLAEAIKGIIQHKVTSVLMEHAADVRLLLSRFAECDPLPKGIFGRIKYLLAQFFEILRKQFAWIDALWEASAAEVQKKLEWDCNLLAELCHEAPTEPISMLDALKYLLKMLKRQQVGACHPELTERIKEAIKIAKQQAALRQDFSARQLHSVSSALLKQIDALTEGKKILLPAGYFDQGRLQELLLEIGKQPDGTLQVTLISASGEIREFFDQEDTLAGSKQAIRREILNVKMEDLQVRLPVLIELVTSPECREKNSSHSWRGLFFDCLRFPDSQVAVTPSTEKYDAKSAKKIGHFSEAIAYLEEGPNDPEEKQRFDLSLRLHLFLDLVRKQKNSWGNPRFRHLIRTIVHELASEIETHKGLLGSASAQTAELTRIYNALKEILQRLEATPVQVANPAVQKLAPTSGRIEVQAAPTLPMLTLSRNLQSSEWLEIAPPLALLDKQKPADTFLLWLQRLKQLSKSETKEKMDWGAREAMLIARMLPPLEDPFWHKLSQNEAIDLIEALKAAAKMMAANASYNTPSVEEIQTVVLLSAYAYHAGVTKGVLDADAQFGINIAGEEGFMEPKSMQEILKYFLEQLCKCRISSADQQRLSKLNTKAQAASSNAYRQANGQVFIKSLETLYIANQGANLSTPLYLQHPHYARTTALEITNRYVTEQCPLGCTCDNCPNYANVDKNAHRFHPLYMLHNFADIFAAESLSKGLARDEAIDLLYTQTTLESASKVFLNVHHKNHGTRFAHGFSAEDCKLQLMMSWMAFMQHPHFFKSPELRWHFETKLFTRNTFATLLDAEHQPFVKNMLKQLNREIKISHASGDLEKCVYLIHVQDQIRAIIQESIKQESSQQESSAVPQKKSTLFNLFGFFDTVFSSAEAPVDNRALSQLLVPDTERLLQNLVKELLHVNDSRAVDKQSLVFSLYLSNCYEKFCRNPADPLFGEQETLTTLFLIDQRLRGMKEASVKLDPALLGRMRPLRALIQPRIAQLLSSSKTAAEQFANELLLITHPAVAAKRLAWQVSKLPLLTAEDTQGTTHFFDIDTGEVHSGGGASNMLPEIAREHALVHKLFGKAVEDNWTLLAPIEEESIQSFIHPSFPLFRLHVKNSKSGDAQLVIERLLQTPEGGQKWAAFVRFRDQDRVLNGEELDSPHDLPIAIASAIGDRECWVDRNKEHIYVMDGEQRFAMLTLKDYSRMMHDLRQGGGLEETHIVEMEFMQDHTYLLQPDAQAMERFTPIEAPDFLEVRGRQNAPAEAAYPRYAIAGSQTRLKYTIGAEGIQSVNFPGFTLAENSAKAGSKDPAFGCKPLPDTFENYQLLRKGGSEKVLIPMRPFEQQFSVKGEPLPWCKMKFPSDFALCPIFEYQVDSDSNRLVSSSADGYAYLSYVCFSHGDYSSAHFYLDKARTSSGYSASHDQIMQWMNDWSDSSPNGICLQLRFALFMENVLVERRYASAVQGKLIGISEIDFNRSARLFKLAETYEAYVRSPQKELDPLLALSPGELQQTRALIQELIESHGDETVERRELQPIRAKNLPVPTLLDKGELHRISHMGTALAFWSANQPGAGISMETLKSPMWLVNNFAQIFNQLLKGELDSPASKQLLLQLEIVSRLPQEKLLARDQLLIKLAQGYLLKLAAIKKSYPAILQDLKSHFPEGIGIDRSRRQTYISNELMQICTAQQLLYPHNTLDKTVAIECLYRCIQSVTGSTIGYNQSTRACHTLREWIVFCQTYNGGNFSKDYRSFLLREIYGESAAKSINTLQQVMQVLDPIPISLPQQSLVPDTRVSATSKQTNRERFQPLLATHLPATIAAEIKTLSNTLFSGTTPPSPPLISTPPDKQKRVLGALADKLAAPALIQVGTTPAPAVSRAVFERLKASHEPVIARNAREHEEDMDAALKEMPSIVIRRQSAQKILTDLEQAVRDSEGTHAKLRTDLAQLIENFETPAGIIAMRRLTGRAVKPNLDLIIALWRGGEITRPWKENVFKQIGLRQITPQVLQEINNKIQAYLLATTADRQLQRALEAAKDYLHACGPAEGDLGDKFQALQLYDILTARRYYAEGDADLCDLLYMEYSQGILLREGQVSTYREMIANPNAVRQLQMGGGKSKVLNPLLAKRKANGRNLVLLLLPEELYETNCRDLDATNRMLFGQTMQRFEFSRSSEKNLEALQLQHKRLLEAVRDRGYVVTTKRSMLSFKNAFTEKLYKLKQLPPSASAARAELLAEIREMSAILTLFRKHTDVLADEVDACLDVRKEVNFSLGEGTPVDPIKKDIGVQMMRLILEGANGSLTSELKKALAADQEELSPAEKRQQLAELEKFDTETRPRLLLLKKNILENTQAALSPEERKQCLASIASAYRLKFRLPYPEAAFIDYIMDRPTGQDVEKEVLQLKHNDKKAYQQISALKGLIHEGFGCTLGKVGMVKYGRAGIWTIPYKASNVPNYGSEYDADLEKIAFTLQDYLQFGANYQQVYRTIAKLHASAVQEMRAPADPDKLIGINDTQAAADFKKLLKNMQPQGTLAQTLSLSAAADPMRIEAIVAAINATPEGRLAYAENYVLNQMEQSNLQINSSSFDLPDMVDHFSGFTGTPWNLHAYPDKVDGRKNLGVDGRTWVLMLSKLKDTPIRTFEFNPEQPVASLLENVGFVEEAQALIDTGAYLRGISNEQFTQSALKKAQKDRVPLEGVIYFDEAGSIVKKRTADSAPLALETAQTVDRMHDRTLYDQAHTVGADIKQGKKAKAVVTIGEETFIRDLFQAVWRLRELDKEQTVEFAVSNKIKQRILGGQARELTVEDILAFCLSNQGSREGDDNERGESDAISNSAKRATFNGSVDLIHEGAADETIVQLVHQLFPSEGQGLLLKKRPGEESFDRYTPIKTSEPPQKKLTRIKEHEATRCAAWGSKLQSLDPKGSAQLHAVGAAVKSRKEKPADQMLKEVSSTEGKEGKEVELEAQAEVDISIEKLNEMLSEQEAQKVKEVVIPKVDTGAAGSGEVHSITTAPLMNVWNNYEDANLRRISNVCPYFDDQIFCTHVFERNLPEKVQSDASPQALFYTNRKTPHMALILKDAQGKMNMVIPTVHEAHAACREFVKERSGYEGTVIAVTPTEPLLLYKSGSERSEKLPFVAEQDAKAFYRLYVQLKLFKGEINFDTPQEKEALVAWLQEKGVKAFRDYFEKNILSTKSRRFADAYPQSSLCKLFDQLSAPA
jgi:hypothetical protein